MLRRSVLVVCAAAVACSAPLASARVLDVLVDITAEATVPGGAVVSFTPDPGVTCIPASGSLFPISQTPTPVQCTFDADGTAAGSFTVTVRDTTPPVVTPPADVTATAGDPSGTSATYGSASATDAVAGSPPANCSPASGSNFAVGTTTVTCSASDGTNVGTATFTVTVNLVDGTPPTVSVPGPVTAEATAPAGASVPFSVSANDTIDPSPTVSCNRTSGDTFPLGTTTVSCTATDASNNTSSSATFNVSVVDTTPPVVTAPADVTATAGDPSGTSATYGTASATDAVAGSPPATCSPPSGSNFAVGTTTVTCSASDGTNVGTATFTVTVNLVDGTPPTVSVPGSITAEATGPAGASVPFSVSANDTIDPSPTVSCNRTSGDTFPLGTTTVSCTATDASNNTSSSATFNVSVVDRGPPTIVVPGSITAEAIGPGGAPATFSVIAADNVDPSPSVSCSSSSGATFPIGTTTVSCTARDASNNASTPATFNVNVVDTTPPNLSAVSGDITAEANGPTGSQVTFAAPTAVDLGAPIPAVPCVPASGSTFPLGATTVTCSATDPSGNTGSATFKVSVVDTTPPSLIPPGDTSVYATVETGSDANDQGPISRFVGGAYAADIVDPNPRLTSDAPLFFWVGTTTVTFTAIDASGNRATATARLTVVPKPAPGTTPPPLPPPADNIPPPNVTGLKAKAGNGQATIAWAGSTAPDFDHYEVFRTTSPGFKAAGTLVYRGTGTTFTDRGLRNGVEYRYVVVSVDKTGNSSAGVAIVVVPKKSLLRTPADGARLKKIPKEFAWQRDPRATYYNLQLYAGSTLLFQNTAADPKKILSVFPTKPLYKFKSPWKWEGRKYRMTKGLYTWYVWPGYGARANVTYGPLIGSATFQLTK